METLKYIVEDKTIAKLLGTQNFSTDESAVLELVKNAYDANATKIVIEFLKDKMIITDNGIGMDEYDIKSNWMCIGKSNKVYENDFNRVLSGSKGIGRFALAKLGRNVELISKKINKDTITWTTDWNESFLEVKQDLDDIGTKIIISGLYENWGKRKINVLIDFLSRTYDDDSMEIIVKWANGELKVPRYFMEPILGVNCSSIIDLKYNSDSQILETIISSDEFTDEAISFCKNIDIKKYSSSIHLVDEFKDFNEFDGNVEIEEYLEQIGSFGAQLCFYVKPTKDDSKKFCYKNITLSDSLPNGVALFRNAFGISSYEGHKDWLGLGIRSRKSPAAASHPTGAWRVRENQLYGKVMIDKKENDMLQDLSNRQGLEENIYYELFLKIVLTGIREFERFRQNIIRHIDVKNKKDKDVQHFIIDRIIANYNVVFDLRPEEAKLLSLEVKQLKDLQKNAKRERSDVENRYKYDVRILNVLATIGLKASAIAHELRNDRNYIHHNVDNIINALKYYELWDTLNLPDNIAKAYRNMPELLESNRLINNKVLLFMSTMLENIEKKKFKPSKMSILRILEDIISFWKQDYAWVDFEVLGDEGISLFTSLDIMQVVFDNLILNSIQQNEKRNKLSIKIYLRQHNDKINFVYFDDGKGLDKKYIDNPYKILEVHETNRNDGHGLGMWMVNNTIVMTGGKITAIDGTNGFKIEFFVGGEF